MDQHLLSRRGRMQTAVFGLAFFVLSGFAPAQTPAKKGTVLPKNPVPAPATRPAWTAPAPGTFELKYRKSDSLADVLGAHASFEYGTQDVRITWNSWDISLSGDGTDKLPYVFRSSITTDDENEIIDLGAVDFDQAAIADKAHPSPDTVKAVSGLGVVKGHVYLIHSKDTICDFWAKVRVDEVVAQDKVTITWQLLSRPQRFRDRSGPMSGRTLIDFYAKWGEKPPAVPAKKP